MQWYVKYHVILDRDITAFDCIVLGYLSILLTQYDYICLQSKHVKC